MKDVQCYELFGGIALKNHAFSFQYERNFRRKIEIVCSLSMALDDSTDISDTALLVVFIGAVTIDLDVVEELS